MRKSREGLMMIPDYDDDVKMAELGRSSARYKAIKNAREKIRDCAVFIGNSNDVGEIIKLQDSITKNIDDLIHALATGNMQRQDRITDGQ